GVGVAAHVLVLAGLVQLSSQDERVHGFALVVQVGDGGEDFLVGVGVEMFGTKDEDDVADDDVVAQHAAEDGALRLTVLRRQPFGTFFFRRHSSTSCGPASLPDRRNSANPLPVSGSGISPFYLLLPTAPADARSPRWANGRAR